MDLKNKDNEMTKDDWISFALISIASICFTIYLDSIAIGIGMFCIFAYINRSFVKP